MLGHRPCDQEVMGLTAVWLVYLCTYLLTSGYVTVCITVIPYGRWLRCSFEMGTHEELKDTFNL